MAKKEAVANTSSILFIAKLKRFDLLKNIFSNIIIPEEVTEEMFSKNSIENEVIKKELQNFLQKTKVKDIKKLNIDKGEEGAISLCLEKNIVIFISDDKKARKIARGLEIKTIGLVGIIKYNLQEKKIKKDEAKKLITLLIKNDYYMSPSLYTEIMDFINKE